MTSRPTAAAKALASLAFAALAVAACSRPAEQPKGAPAPGSAQSPAQAPAADATQAGPITAPAGDYTLDKAHASVTFRVDHLAFSHYTAGFDRFDAKLAFDPASPDKSSVTATIDAGSLRLPSPPEGFVDEIKGSDWLDAGRYPQIAFRSTKVEPTGGRNARITGDLTLHGVTRPVTLEAVFNGGYAGNPYDPNARVGFSAHGAFNRSEFGVAAGIPAPGSNLGVSDRVEVQIEAEFTGPAWKPPANEAQPSAG